ncbi:MAG: hypothetical protein R2734_08550 [Nocardioides sp.]
MRSPEAFHEALAKGTAALAGHAATTTGVRTVGLSGGVYVNRLLLAATTRLLQERDLEVLTHARPRQRRRPDPRPGGRRPPPPDPDPSR